jgi:hypothetical protein
MAVFVSNIVIEQGFDFDTTFQLEDTTTNALLNLTGYTMDAQLRKTYSSSSSVSFGSTITSATGGTIQITLTSSQTSDLKPGRYVYDVKLTTSGGTVTKAVEGAALVRAGVTR